MEIKPECILLKRFGKFILLGIGIMLLLSAVSFAQQRTITGSVTCSDNNLPQPGVNILVQGTSTGTITDLEGMYAIEIPDGDVTLQFSFVGFNTELISVGNSTEIDVVLTPIFMAIDEVVITSLGISREKKEITYAAQNIEMDNLTQARELNVVNSLAGKVAGLDVIKSNSGVGSGTRILLRGNRTISGENQPLYVVDGVPISSGAINEVRSEYGGVQSADGMSNINPEDIESITVLKGPNAAAIYGSRGNNGAIIITTKKGVARKGIGIEFSSNFSLETPILLTRTQHKFGQGTAGTYVRNQEWMWGPEMSGQMVDHWSPDPNWDGPAQYAFTANPDNLKDFFVTGNNWVNTLALNTGNERSQMYFSYTNTRAQGIVEYNKLRRNNFNLRLTSDMTQRLSADAKLTYFNEDVDNRMATGDWFINPMRAIYRQPSNISLDDAKTYEYYDNAGNLRQHFWNPGSNGGQNIYWLLNRTLREDMRHRVIGMASLRYEFIDGLSLMIRSSFDKTFHQFIQKVHNDTYTIAPNGYYQHWRGEYLEMNNEFLLNYNTIFGDLLSLNVSFGGNMRLYNWQGLNAASGRTYSTENLLKPNLFAISNTNNIFGSDFDVEKKIHSLYGFATIGLKNFLFLDITGRNDWSSTLPKDNWSYFYPSVGLTWVISDMVNMPTFLPFAKLRGSYAYVANDTDPYRLNLNYYFIPAGDQGYTWKDTVLPAENLKPEQSRSIEAGVDLAFIKNRVAFDLTWYRTNTYNQLMTVPVPDPSGFQAKFINAGNIQNSGVELTLRITPVRGEFTWDLAFNYAANKSLVIELTDELDEFTIRDPSWMTTIKVAEGSQYGDVYTKGFLRNEDGRVLIRPDGLPRVTEGHTIPMGNYNPDWFGGISNIFSYKGFDLNVLFDMRMGGNIFSYTEAVLAYDGITDYTLEGREGMVVDGVLETDGSENNIEITSQQYWQHLGGREANCTGELFRYDASFVRFRELVLGYTFNFNNPSIQNLRLALVGRNLGFLYNAAEVVDPNVGVGISNYQGVEGFGIPTTRSMGVNLKLTF